MAAHPLILMKRRRNSTTSCQQVLYPKCRYGALRKCVLLDTLPQSLPQPLLTLQEDGGAATVLPVLNLLSVFM